MEPIPVEGAAVASIAMATAAGFWGLFVPSPVDLARDGYGRKPELCKLVRRGQAQALAFSVVLGLGISTLCRSPWPILGVVALDVYLLWEYEQALKAAEGPHHAPNVADAQSVNSWRDA